MSRARELVLCGLAGVILWAVREPTKPVWVACLLCGVWIAILCAGIRRGDKC